MSKTILVTGIGAVIGQGVVKSVRKYGDFRIIGIDRGPAVYGSYLCDVFYQKPCDDNLPEYWNFLQSVVNKHDVALIIPGIEQDVFFFHAHRDKVAGLGCEIVLNSSKTIESGQDKYLLFQELQSVKKYIIPTFVGRKWEACCECLGAPPFLFKPRRGSGGKGQAMLDDQMDFDYHSVKFSDDFMVQSVVGDDDHEYTVAIYGFGDGESTGPAIMKRKLGPGGATWEAEVVAGHGPIEEAVSLLTRFYEPLGPTNYQFREDRSGGLYLLEINPRISASTSIRAALGYNEAAMCIEHFLLGRTNFECTIKLGKAVRFLEDYVVTR